MNNKTKFKVHAGLMFDGAVDPTDVLINDLGAGTIATKNAGTSEGDAIELTATGLPAISGENLLNVLKPTDLGDTVQSYDVDTLKSDISTLLKAVYGDEAQIHTGNYLSYLTVTRNHIVWELTMYSYFNDVILPYDGTYVFHIYPSTYNLDISSSFKTDGNLPDFNRYAGEVRIVVEQYNSRKSIVSLQNFEV